MEYDQQIKRINRALFYDIFFLLDIKKDLNELEFKLAGSSGNLYDIRLTQTIFNCSCSDMKSSSYCCKHICYIILKILNLEHKTILNKNIAEEQYNHITNNIHEFECKIDKKSNIYKKFKNVHCFEKITETPNDSCIICYDKLETYKGIVKCSQCNNYICKMCFDLWFETKKTCPYCRSYIILNTNIDYVNLYDV